MNKKQLVEQMSDRLVMTKVTATAILDFILDTIKDQLRNQEEVSIGGFGTFKVKNMKARQGRNPKTGELLEIPAKSKLVFKPAKQLKDILVVK